MQGHISLCASVQNDGTKTRTYLCTGVEHVSQKHTQVMFALF